MGRPREATEIAPNPHLRLMWGLPFSAPMLESLGRSIWERFGSPLGAIWGPSWAPLGPTWGHLGSSWAILGPSWGHPWCRLGPSWGHLGPLLAILGPLWRHRFNRPSMRPGGMREAIESGHPSVGRDKTWFGQGSVCQQTTL